MQKVLSAVIRDLKVKKKKKKERERRVESAENGQMG